MDDLKDVQKTLNDINVKLGQYNILLDQHIKRTDALETELQKHAKVYSFVELGFKLVVAIGVIVAILKNFGVF